MANEISIIVRVQNQASRGFDRIGQAAVGMNAAIDSVGSALDALDSIQSSSARKAEKLAQAHLGVEQAMADEHQAANDLKQAQLDANQAQLDATAAQTDYNDAVKKFGANSQEARQAQADLAQAQADSTQATSDMEQANIDAKQAQLDLNAAQRELNPTPIQIAAQKFQELAPVIGLAMVAMQGLTGAMLANPIGLVALAVGGLVLGLVALWKKSQTAREVMATAFSGISVAVLSMVEVALKAYRGMSNAVLQVVETTLRALGKIPGNDWADRAADDVRGFRDGANKFFDSAIGKTKEWKQAAENLPKKIKLEGDSRDLEEKLRHAQGSLAKLPPGKRTVVQAEVTSALQKIAMVQARLSALKNRNVSVTTYYSEIRRDQATAGRAGKASGGVVGQAASGGGRSGLTMTGEHGPELLRLPPGTQVRSNPDTRRALSAGSGGGEIVHRIILEGTGMLKGLREEIRIKGGNVQEVLGR